MAENLYFAMAFFFGFTPEQVDRMEAKTAMKLVDGLKKNPGAAALKAITKGMGI